MLTIGFILALVRTFFIALAFAIPLFFLILATIGAVLLQNNYAQIIVEIENNPTQSEFITLIANTIVLTINLLIDILRFIIEVWDFFLPFLYMALDLLIPAIERLISVLFGTPSLQCIIAEIADVIMTALNHLLVGFQLIVFGAERGIEQLGKARGLNSIKPFTREFVAIRNSTGYLIRRNTKLAQAEVPVNSTTPSQNPGTEGTCPTHSIVLSFFLPLLLIIIDVGSVILAFLMPMLIDLLAITITTLIQILPQLLSAIGQVFQALSSNGVFGDLWTMFKEIISILAPIWDALCPALAIVLWLLCTLENFFQNFLQSALGSDIVSVVCWTDKYIFDPIIGLFKRDLEHDLEEFIDDPHNYDPLNLFEQSSDGDLGNDVKYNLLFSRRTNSSNPTVITNYAVKVGKHHAYHRQTIFRPSNKRMQYEEAKRRGSLADHMATTRVQRAVHPYSRWHDSLFEGAAEVVNLLPAHHKRDMLQSMATYQLSFNIGKNPRDAASATHQHRTSDLLVQTSGTMDQATTTANPFPLGPAQANSTNLCNTGDQATLSYGPDDDDDTILGSGDGGQVQTMSNTVGDNTPNRCKSVWAMCPCTKGNVGNPGESTWQGAKVVGQCIVKSLKQIITELLQLIKEFIHFAVDLFKALPQILIALLKFANDLLIDIAEFIDELVVDESPLIKSLFNALHFMAGAPAALGSLNYTDYRNMFPQHQGLDQVNLAASSDQQCPNNITAVEMASDPRCPYYSCVQENPPELCYFPNQENPGGSASQPITPNAAYTMSREPLSRDEFISLSPQDRARIKDRFRVLTVMLGEHTSIPHVAGRADLQALWQTFTNKRASLFGTDNPAYQQMMTSYNQATGFFLRLNDMGVFSAAGNYPTAGGHAYSYEPNNVLETPSTTTVPDTPVTTGSNPPSSSCRANATNPYQCCTSNSTVYECCRGLIGCIPPIPPGFKLKPWSGLNWIGNITEQTCEPFTFGFTGALYPLNGLKEVLFILRLIFGEFTYWFIKDSPSQAIMGFWQFLLGWLTFPQNQLPPYAFVCFFFNLGGLLLLATILIILWIIYEGFEEWFADLADIFEAFKLQSEINQEMQNQMMLFSAIQPTPTSALMIQRPPGPRTRFIRHAIRRAASRSKNHV